MKLRSLRVAGGGLLLIFLANALAGFVYFRHGTQKPYSTAVYDENNQLLRAFITPDEKWRFQLDSASLRGEIVNQLVCLEDRRFWYHPGVDPIALARATWQNITAGRVVSGGSTLTMQLVRLLDPKPRTFWNKAVEAWAAVILELVTSKRDILRLYLSYAPYGSNIEGIEAAAYRYFKKHVNQLDAKEAAFLFLLHQTPARLFNFNQTDWQKQLRLSLARLARCGLITAEEELRLGSEPFEINQHEFPTYAPHFAEFVVNESTGQNVHSTLNSGMQKALERKIASVRQNFFERGIYNTSIIVADHQSGEVKAIIGNFDYLRSRHSQRMTTFLTHRSPGSTLKPFVYALGIEEGLILPDALVEDVPVSYQYYSPQNYSGKFTGVVTAEYALSHSLNVPFVRLLERLGLPYFLKKLNVAGVEFRQRISDLGLSVIIGGGELRPWDVTQLYTSLGRSGEIVKLKYQKNQKTATFPLLTPATTFLARRALGKRDRPDYPKRSEFAQPRAEVYWKTGTSQGRRDAWSIGVGSDYVVSVWLGNLDRSPSPHLIGSDAAAPLMFDILAMFENGTPQVERFPEDLVEVKVCRFSGYPAQSFCPQHKRVLAYQKRVPAKRCPYHKRILVEEDSDLRVGPQCRSEVGHVTSKTVLHFPPRVRAWLDPSVRSDAVEYKLHPKCEDNTEVRSSLDIKAPRDGQKFMLLASQGEPTLKLPILLESSFPLSKVTCFLNGNQVSAGKLAEAGFIEVAKGAHLLHCIDPAGRARSRRFFVL